MHQISLSPRHYWNFGIRYLFFANIYTFLLSWVNYTNSLSTVNSLATNQLQPSSLLWLTCCNIGLWKVIRLIPTITSHLQLLFLDGAKAIIKAISEPGISLVWCDHETCLVCLDLTMDSTQFPVEDLWKHFVETFSPDFVFYESTEKTKLLSSI